LKSLGYQEGSNLLIEYRQFGNDVTSMQAMAAELVRANVDVILVDGPGEATLRAVLTETQSIPVVVMAINFDPLESRYISSLARPGGNLTGVALRLPELAAKQIELASEMSPSPRLAILWDEFTASQFEAASKAAQVRGLEVRSLKQETRPYDFHAAFRTIAAGPPAIALVISSAYFALQRSDIARAAIEFKVPTLFTLRHYVEQGGLMSYGPDHAVMRRRAVALVDRVLKGAKPGDLPFEQPTAWGLTINLKTASAINFDVPPLVLTRADEVIE
jgi:putative ABC transport system substrate-binding protein